MSRLGRVEKKRSLVPEQLFPLLDSGPVVRLNVPMAWIRTVNPQEATGLLGRLYRQALERAGKVFGILRCQSPRPKVLEASIDLYLEIMHSDRGSLTRAQREMLATAVSRANRCFY